MFQPDYHNIVDAAENREPKRLPLYDHKLEHDLIAKIIGEPDFPAYFCDDEKKLDIFFKKYDRFFFDHGYDTVTYEACVTRILPHGGALAHPQPGWIDSREKFEAYPWEDVKRIYIDKFDKYFTAMANNLPAGMKAIGGVGNGIFEIVQDLCGYENLCILGFDDPELYADMFRKVGDLLYSIWEWFLARHGDAFCVCRFGDDLGYKSNTLLRPEDIREHIIPQYKRIVGLVHSYGKPFLLHSCGCIFNVMDDIIRDAKIDAKHSNEDQIAEFGVWVEKYGDRIGNFGGVDTDHLCRMDNDKLKELVTDLYRRFSHGHGGIAIGSGNSITSYVDPEKYLIMLNTVRELRGDFSDGK